jgi:hypothetical protein
MTSDRTAIARLLEYWLERAAEEEGFGNRVKITDMVTHEAIDVVKRLDLLRAFDPTPTTSTTGPSGYFNNEGRTPQLRLIQGGRA